MAKSTIQVLVSTVLLLLVHRGEQARLLRGDQNVALPDYSVYHTKCVCVAWAVYACMSPRTFLVLSWAGWLQERSPGQGR